MSESSSTQRGTLDLKTAFALAVKAGEEGRLDEAEGLYRAILRSVPVPEVSRNLALLLDDRGAYADAEAALRAGLAAHRDDPVLRLQMAFLLLRAGRLSEAWPFFEARLQRPGAHPKPKLSFPEWQGEPVSSLLIWHEQGLGDQIQFARFATHLSQEAKITLMCHPALVRLFKSLGVDVIGTEGKVDLSRHDAWVMSGSIPGIIGTTLETIPPAPYLPAGGGGVGVGVVTRGAPGHPNDANRSLPETVAQALRALVPGARSLLQADTGAKDLRDTADIIAGLDLVISVDTSVAHLAGAMGKDCWVLLPHKADWRWMRDRADSPWYPSLRLFRQASPGGWDGVLAEVGEALGERAR